MTSPQERRESTARLLEEMHAAPEHSPLRLSARNELVELHAPLVQHCVYRFRGRGEPVEDLAQVGTIGLIRAIDRFDPTRDVEFASYAVPTIVGEVRRYFRDRTHIVRVPRTISDRFSVVTTAVERLTADLGRAPTAAQVAEATGLGVDVILEVLDAAQSRTVSLDGAASGADAGSLAETLGAPDPDMEAVETKALVDSALDSFTDRDRTIVRRRLFDQMTQSEIAREVGLSQMQVSRILARFGEQVRRQMVEV